MLHILVYNQLINALKLIKKIKKSVCISKGQYTTEISALGRLALRSLPLILVTCSHYVTISDKIATLSDLEALLAAALHPVHSVHLLEAALGLPSPAPAVDQAVVDQDPRLFPGQSVSMNVFYCTL